MPHRPSPWWVILSVMFVLLVAVQVLPYGRNHTNPPVGEEPPWDSPQTRALVKQACFDCHSNETEWPWYSHVAPASWLIERDVRQARAQLNFSEWNRRPDRVEDRIEDALNGEMPRSIYTMLDAHGRLAPSDRIFLARGLSRTMALAERRGR